MSEFEAYKAENGSVVVDGVEYAILEQAVIADNGTQYKAYGFSEDQEASWESDEIDLGFDAHVVITWDCAEEWLNDENATDEADACNWEVASVEEL